MNPVLTDPEDATDYGEPLITHHDCRSGHHYGTCPDCGRAHGWKIHLQPGGEGFYVRAPLHNSAVNHSAPPLRKALGLRYTR